MSRLRHPFPAPIAPPFGHRYAHVPNITTRKIRLFCSCLLKITLFTSIIFLCYDIIYTYMLLLLKRQAHRMLKENVICVQRLGWVWRRPIHHLFILCSALSSSEFLRWPKPLTKGKFFLLDRQFGIHTYLRDLSTLVAKKKEPTTPRIIQYKFWN